MFRKPIWEDIDVLSVDDVHAYYGDSHILKGMSFSLGIGRVATLLGRNGAGKTTMLRTIMGLLPAARGIVRLGNANITKLRPHQIANLGVGYVPEERAIFPSLSVYENLTLPLSKGRKGLWDIDKIYHHFPVLKLRSHHGGSKLSGGEQQMLAIARILTMNVRLILLDEPTEGLAPLLVREIGHIVEQLKKEDMTILLVEQNTRFAVRVADYHFVIYNGRIAYSGSNEELEADDEVKSRYLGV
ncbi:MAG: ABC transporter ATP-binding protein [Thermodesulfobacteriota bacterium]